MDRTVAGAGAAATAAGARTKLGVTDKDAHLAIVSTPDGGRLAWVVLPQVPAGFPTAPRVIVDAQTGAVIEARDLVVFANKVQIYDTNPIASPTLGARDLPILRNDMAGHLAGDWVQSNNCIDKKTTKNVSFGGFTLPMHVCDLVQTATPDVNGDYVFTPNDTPNDPAARFNCGVFAYQLGKFGAALKYLDGLDNPKAEKMRQRVRDEMKAQGLDTGGATY